ncbi:MAG: T9SS type A sorting domain-containing protein [Calditrichaeota bacterium]|nr:T9SS type A sorting domain-containing protein [Calditrichota bacterium]
MRLILMCALTMLFAGSVMAQNVEVATLAFDELHQKMHLIVALDEPANMILPDLDHGAIGCGEWQTYDPTTDQLISGAFAEGVTYHWCEMTLTVDQLPLNTPVSITGEVHLYDADYNPMGTVNIPDWNSLQTTDGVTLQYLEDGCTPVLPEIISINSAFCATVCHNAYVIPIECEDPGYTPQTLEVSVTNRCHPDETECNDPVCTGVDWSLFNWNIRVFPDCGLFLTMSYCGEGPGCVCIWRSDFVLPVEIAGFSAVAGDGEVRLNWNTASESNLKNFRVTRSTQMDGVYNEVARTNASNTSTGSNYSFVDRTVENGTTYYYKLHVEDIEGNLSVYNIDGTSVVVEATPTSGAEVVTEYALAQNYPNPFNAQTNFDFTLPMASNVTLKVYDLLGREVATVINGAMNAGSHTVNWSAEGLATGVYMYTLTAGEFSQSKKLVYLK